MANKINIHHSCFQGVPKKVLLVFEDEELEVTPIFGFDDEEECYDVRSEFDGGCVELWGVPREAFIEFDEAEK